jgi:hypothetical protein
VETRAATFVLVPGDSHTAGMSATTDAFRTRGWDITLLVGYSHDELVARFETSTDQIFGFWAGSKQSLDALARIVVALTVSHPAAHVLVTGQIAVKGVSSVGLQTMQLFVAIAGAILWLIMFSG